MYVTTSLESLGWPAVCLSSEPAGRPSECCKDFNVAIFSDTIHTIYVKLCMKVVLIELYLFVALSVTLTVFQGHSNVKHF